MELYSTGCPKCKVLIKKLDAKGFNYRLVEDYKEVNDYAEAHHVTSAPFLVLDDGDILDFIEANRYISTI